MSRKANELVAQQSSDLVDKITAESDAEELERLKTLFQQMQLKRNMIRADGLNRIIEKIDEEVETRLDSDPGSISNKDIIAYMNSTTNALSSINQSVNNPNQTFVQINDNSVNISGSASGLSEASRKNVLEALEQIMNGEGIEMQDFLDAEFDEKESV